MRIKNKKATGFTLVELMITVTVLGVITALAIPAYQNYVTRSQVAESVALFDGKRVGAEDFIHLNGIGGGRTFQTVSDLNSQYIEKGLESYNSTYYDIAFMYGNNSNKELQGKTILFFNEASSTDNILWECETDIDKKYLPGNLKCSFQEVNPGPEPGGESSYCDSTTSPSLDDMPDIEGYGKMYDAKYNQYIYYKDVGEGRILYGEFNNSYLDKDGNSIYYDSKKGRISSFWDKDDNFVMDDGSVNMVASGFSLEYYSVKNYQRALAEVARLEGNPVMTEKEKENYNYYKAGLDSGEFKAEADKFFTKYEEMYMKDGQLDPNAPKVVTDFYNNLDRNDYSYNPSSLLDVNSYPEIIDNIDEIDHGKTSLYPYVCPKDPNIPG